MVDEKKVIVSLDNVKVTRIGDRVEVTCPIGMKDDEGKTPCDRLAEMLIGAKEIATLNVVTNEKVESAKKEAKK